MDCIGPKPLAFITKKHKRWNVHRDISERLGRVRTVLKLHISLSSQDDKAAALSSGVNLSSGPNTL